jgi:hypothetical protein
MARYGRLLIDAQWEKVRLAEATLATIRRAFFRVSCFMIMFPNVLK